MAKRLLDYDPIHGLAAWWDYEAHSDTGIVSYTQDVTELLDQNIRSANDDDKTKRGIKNDWWKYADIPAAVWLKWKLEKGVDIFDKNHRKALFKLLNDPEYRHLKTTSKRHDG